MLKGRALLLALVLVFTLSMIITADISVVSADTHEAEENAALEMPDTAGVEGGAYEVTSYALRAAVNKDHSYDVEETISVDIPDQLQSIEFVIPSGNFRVSDILVDGSSYNMAKGSSSNTVIITDPDKLSAGVHEYTIAFLIQEYRDGDNTEDIFYFNALPPDWKQPIGKLAIEVSFPADFPFDDMQCYAGQFGVQDSTSKITFKKKEGDKTVSISGSLIPENYGIALKARLGNGYWSGALSGAWAFVSTIVSMAAAALILAILWLIGGRDPRIKKQKITKPLEGLSSVELGYVYNNRVGTRDVIRMLLEFAIKGYLRISEYEPKKYRIYREEDPVEEEKMYRNAYNILFEDVFRDRAIETEELIERLRLIKRGIRDDVAAGFASPESSPFTPLSRIFRYIGAAVYGTGLALANDFSYIYAHQSANYIESALMGIIAAASSLLLCRAFDSADSSPAGMGSAYEIAASLIAAIPVAYVSADLVRNTGDPIPAFAVAAASAVSLFLLVIMRARGRENAELVTSLRQLRHFIYHPTPKELLENHLADDRYYYDMLLYALAFGAEESWAISFLTLDVKEPEWFTDDIEGEAFSNLKAKKETVDYARDIKSFVRTVGTAYNEKMRQSGGDK